MATQIQSSMLPCTFPAFPEYEEFEIFASMNPAKEVGGDFYDFFLVDKDHLALVIADVTGKGVPAALFMMITKTLLKNEAQSGASPMAVLESVNNQLLENNEAGMEDVTYSEYTMELHAGDVLFVYTDGVAEATDGNKKLYGAERMVSALNQKHETDARELCEIVRADIDRFVGDAEQFDDITMLALRIKR